MNDIFTVTGSFIHLVLQKHYLSVLKTVANILISVTLMYIFLGLSDE